MLKVSLHQKNLTSEEYRERQAKRTERDEDDDETDERGGSGEDPAMG